MKSEISIDTEDSETLSKILSPSLKSRGKIDLGLETMSNQVVISVETDGLGPLRGTTDNVFRLSSLARKIYET
jgi:tRNA threonylcarbamoyladenosine modification (KEOPS) complex  Pcc1 subunit